MFFTIDLNNKGIIIIREKLMDVLRILAYKLFLEKFYGKMIKQLKVKSH